MIELSMLKSDFGRIEEYVCNDASKLHDVPKVDIDIYTI